MAFYSPDASMDQRLSALVQSLEGEVADGLSITWLRFPQSLLPQGRDRQDEGRDSRFAAAVPEPPVQARGASWRGTRLRDSGALVRLPYLIATERWLQRGLLEDEPELRRAERAMIRQGSHEATSYVVDRLSGTTSGPALPAHQRLAWAAQRQLVNGWLASLGWPELEGCNAAQKTWQDGPYGRERDFLGSAMENANRFSSDGLARLLQELLAGALISPPACQRMRGLLAIQPDDEELSVPFLPSLLAALPTAPSGSRRLWGQAGRTPRSLQLALYGECPGEDPMLLVMLAEAEGGLDRDALPERVVTELFAEAVGAG